MRLEMLESVPVGSVSVWDCGGYQGSVHWGEIMSRAVTERSCVGAVVDGVVVIPAQLVEEVLTEAEQRAAVETEMRAELAAGALPSDVYARLGSF